MRQPTMERLRDCAYRLADFLLKSDQIEKAIPYIHRLQSLGRDDWQVGLAFLIRRMLQRCRVCQAARVAHLVEEHLALGDSLRLQHVQQSLWMGLENMWNRCGTEVQQELARQHWVSQIKDLTEAERQQQVFD